MILPTSPSDAEKYLYIDQDKKWYYILSVISLFFIITGMVLFIKILPKFLFYSFFTITILIYLGLSYAIGIFSNKFDYRLHEEITKHDKLDSTIDIFLPCCGENIEVLKNTQKYVKQLNYPKHLIKVYVLDDKGNNELKTITLNNGFNYIHRDNAGWMKKAGNIKNCYDKTNGEFIIIFDADFCPRKDFIKETLPYMRDESIGIVQTPQYFRLHKHHTWIEKGSTYVQELFYRLIQVNRETFNASICVGSNALYRRKALDSNGGTALKEHSEDAWTGFQITNKGFKVKYIPLNLACGMNPDNVSSFFTQQYRWCSGSISLLTTKEFWQSTLDYKQKICYLTGLLYYYGTALGLFFNNLPSLLMIYYAPEYIKWYNLLFIIPSLFFNYVFIPRWSRNKYGLYVDKVKIISYYAHLFAIIDRVKGSVMSWQITGLKNKNSKLIKAKIIMLFYQSIILITLSYGLIINKIEWFNILPITLLFLFNLYINLKAFEIIK